MKNEMIKFLRYDLDRFIDGQIGFEEIQGFVHEDVPIQEAIMLALTQIKFYSKEEHYLYEKLCYAHVLYVLHITPNSPPVEFCAIYFFARGKCSPHKLDWDGLLEKIKMESEVNDVDIARATSWYEQCQKKGGYYSDLLPYYED